MYFPRCTNLGCVCETKMIDYFFYRYTECFFSLLLLNILLRVVLLCRLSAQLSLYCSDEFDVFIVFLLAQRSHVLSFNFSFFCLLLSRSVLDHPWCIFRQFIEVSLFLLLCCSFCSLPQFPVFNSHLNSTQNSRCFRTECICREVSAIFASSLLPLVSLLTLLPCCCGRISHYFSGQFFVSDIPCSLQGVVSAQSRPLLLIAYIQRHNTTSRLISRSTCFTLGCLYYQRVKHYPGIVFSSLISINSSHLFIFVIFV